MNRAVEIISEKPTEHGYVIREEKWTDCDGMVMTTCYTNDGYWIGDEDAARHICAEKGIAPKPSEGVGIGDLRPCSHGWCEREQKWYGWSHRAIYGFGVGSSVAKGDCGYVPTDMEDARLGAIRFWSDDWRLNVDATETTDEDGKPCFEVSWVYSEDVPNEKLRGKTRTGCSYPPEKFGHGEWTAKTLDDAKQMAKDFAEGVG